MDGAARAVHTRNGVTGTGGTMAGTMRATREHGRRVRRRQWLGQHPGRPLLGVQLLFALLNAPGHADPGRATHNNQLLWHSMGNGR